MNDKNDLKLVMDVAFEIMGIPRPKSGNRVLSSYEPTKRAYIILEVDPAEARIVFIGEVPDYLNDWNATWKLVEHIEHTFGVYIQVGQYNGKYGPCKRGECIIGVYGPEGVELKRHHDDPKRAVLLAALAWKRHEELLATTGDTSEVPLYE